VKSVSQQFVGREIAEKQLEISKSVVWTLVLLVRTSAFRRYGEQANSFPSSDEAQGNGPDFSVNQSRLRSFNQWTKQKRSKSDQ